MKTNHILTFLILIICGWPAPAKSQEGEPFPKLGRTYFYSAGELITYFDWKKKPDVNIYPQMFGGSLTWQDDGDFKRYTLEGGSIIFRNRKDDSEIARFTSDIIVWFALPEEK